MNDELRIHALECVLKALLVQVSQLGIKPEHVLSAAKAEIDSPTGPAGTGKDVAGRYLDELFRGIVR